MKFWKLNFFVRVPKLTALMAMIFAARLPAQEMETNHLFHFGTSLSLLSQFNENDARAALKVWAETLVNDGVIQADPTMRIYDSTEAITAALQNKELDGVSVPVNELFLIQEKVPFDHFIFDVVDGSITEEYLLLVRLDSGITNLDDLAGHSLNVLRGARMSLAQTWLNVQLLEKGLPPARKFCGRFTEENKLAKVVLPVFFRQADACLVTRKGFRTMGDLNPQVSGQLRVLAHSPEIATTGFFLRASPLKALQDQVVAQTLRVHTAPAGQQILTVFHTERLIECPGSVLDSAFALMARHRQLLAITNNVKISARESNVARREIGGKN